jgi:hypothetical protein
MALQEEIEKSSSTIHTDNYSMSFGELANLYESKEIDLHPAFQRFFRWKITQKSKFIESVLLGIPLPSIFVSQRKDGVWDVIDGLQRLSTVFEFMGILKDDQGVVRQQLRLEGTRYLPSLDNKVWDSIEGSCLDGSQRLYVKRSKIDVKIIKKESDSNAKYELFQRLNTGGTQLTDQEVRNCILLSVDKDAFESVVKLAGFPAFKSAIPLSESLVDESYDLELLLRFLVLVREPSRGLSRIGDIGEFLTNKAVELAQSKQLDEPTIVEVFYKTFTLIEQGLGEDSIKRYVASKGKFSGAISLAAFEAVVLGIGFAFWKSRDFNLPVERLQSYVKALWDDAEFLEGLKPGMRASQRISKTIPFGRRLFTGHAD